MINDGVVVGRTHRPCGACGVLVAVGATCPHIKAAGPRAPSHNTRNARRAAVKQPVMVARSELLGALGYPRSP